MFKKLLGISAPVFKRRLIAWDQVFVKIALDVAFAFQAKLLVSDSSRHKEISREVQTLAYPAGNQIVQTIPVVILFKVTVMVVNTHSIISHGYKPVYQGVSKLMRDKICRHAQVCAAEPLRLILISFKIKASVSCLQPSVFAGRSITSAHRRKVQRTPGKHVLEIFKPYPFIGFSNTEQPVIMQIQS